MPGYEILQQRTVYEDRPATNFPKKDASCRIGEETHIWCFLDEMLVSRLLFLRQIDIIANKFLRLPAINSKVV